MPHQKPPGLTLTTAPAELPVTLDEVKLQSNLDDTFVADDALIIGFARSATSQAEKFTGRVLITQTWTALYNAWPSVARLDDEPIGEGWHVGLSTLLDSPGRFLELPKPPLQSVTHVKTYDDSDVATTFAATKYFVDTASEPGRIALRKSQAAPVTTRTANGLEIQFVAGYGANFADVPQSIRDGILQMTAFLYKHRGDCPPDKAATASGAAVMWQPFVLMRL